MTLPTPSPTPTLDRFHAQAPADVAERIAFALYVHILEWPGFEGDMAATPAHMQEEVLAEFATVVRDELS